MNDVYERLVILLAEGFGLEAGEIEPELTFSELEMDSLALVELGLTAQQEFGVALADEDIQSGDTIGQAAKTIEAKMAGLG
ncbi:MULTISPECIES: acyl carrier protein [Streptomyces]|uniref:Acyl carrier protein n=1 Tax=Streptomyces triticiradicis TaxID=2651189 RepID=A0A7J5DHS0_9ACTN|nr:phosphopantetheine-binding protein [Streptomyces triticiradicis]KAB1988193.1 acyl carrier protein [Streptomyces triticiradicis]